MPENILVLDRDLEHLELLTKHLKDVGYSVSALSDVRVALAEIEAMAESAWPDLILADITNQELSILSDLLQSRTRLTQVVVVSHAEKAEDVVSALRFGAEDFVLKPVSDFSVLDRVISKLFARNRLFCSNQQFQKELEDANKELKIGITELKADQNAGLKVQLKMLPENDQVISGLHFQHLIKPSLYLSGDFLDYFQLTGNKVLFYFADVSGHGASSAFVTVLLKNLSNRLLRNLRRASSDDALSPVRYLKRVNHELLETKLGKHVTMFVGIYDRSTRNLTYSVGAHFPMPVLSNGTETRFLEGSGMPVGLFEHAEYEEYSIQLPADFELILFSDGILEVLPEKSLAEKEHRLLEQIKKQGQTIREISDGFDLDNLHDLPDDIAILTVSGKKADNAKFQNSSGGS